MSEQEKLMVKEKIKKLLQELEIHEVSYKDNLINVACTVAKNYHIITESDIEGKTSKEIAEILKEKVK